MIALIIGVLALASSLYYGATQAHDAFQKLGELKTAGEQTDHQVYLLGARLEQQILTDRHEKLQERLWKIEDRYGFDLATAPETVREEYREINAQLRALDTELSRAAAEYREKNLKESKSGYYENRSRKVIP